MTGAERTKASREWMTQDQRKSDWELCINFQVASSHFEICFENKIPIKGMAITNRDVIANDNPLMKIKLGCTKNIQPENTVPVIIAM